MKNSESGSLLSKDQNSSDDSSGEVQSPLKEKGPLSFLSGAMTSGLFAWLSLSVSRNMVSYFTLHTPHYNSAIAESIASGFKTLVIGICFLATFTFGFICSAIDVAVCKLVGILSSGKKFKSIFFLPTICTASVCILILF